MIICIRMVKQMKISNIKKISGRVLSYIVSRESIITLITCVAVSIIIVCVAVSIIIGACMVYSRKDEDKSIKVGIIYVGDASTAYTDNFIEALADIKEEYGDKVEVMHMYNVAEGTEREYLERLVNAGCNLIFSTSYNYGETTKELAGKYPMYSFVWQPALMLMRSHTMLIIIHLWVPYMKEDMQQESRQA